MPDKLMQLSAEQQQLLVPLRDEWLAHGLSTQPADRPGAEDGVRMAYRATGFEPPHIFIWLDSPMAGCYGAAMLANLPKGAQVRDQVGAQVRDQVGAQVGDQVRDQVRDQVGDQVWAQVWAQTWAQVRDQVGDQVWAQVGDQVRDQVGDQVWAQVRAQTWAQVRDQVWAQVRAQVGAQVRAQVRDQVGAQVGDQVGAQVGDQVRAQVYRSAWGQHDAWLSFYAYFNRIGLECTDRLAGLMQVARSAGWWWPFAGAVVLTERPTLLHRDREFRLHHETGPALLYPDGWGIHAWHGTRVPADLLAGDGWPVDRILTERNQEIRRCAIERIGWDQFIDRAGLKPVSDTVPDPGNPGNTITLYDVPERLYDEPVRVLLCTNGSVERDGTRRRFGLTVPAAIGDPIAAAAWTYDWDVDTYRKLARRA